MKVHFITHALFEAPGYFESWANEKGFEVGITQLFQNQTLPALTEFDVLIIMGGPQSAMTYMSCPYLSREVDFLKTVIHSGKKIIGVCLGAQLLSIAFGAKAEASPHKEIGFFPIELTQEGQEHSLFRLMPREMVVAHWHSDMPGLPHGSTVLASSTGCPRQIIQFSENTYGFQCHFELTPMLIQALIKHCGADLTDDGLFIQDEKGLLQGNCEQMHRLLSSFLQDFLLDINKRE